MKRLFVVFFLVFFTLGLVGCDLFGGATTSQVVTTETSTTITEQTTTETSDLTLRLMQIYELALEAEAFSGTYEEWLETVRGPEGAPGADGQEVLMQVASGYIQWKHEGDTTWTNLIALTALAGADGIDGKELTLQVAEGKIQWQYVGDTTWSDLIDLSVITGADGIDGKEVAFQVFEGHIQWQYVGENSWVDLVDLVTLTGESGTNGKEVVMQVSGGYVQWQYVGDTTWTNLISIATITGADGIDGTNGVDGKEVILQVTDEYIQWQYVGDTTWTNLIALSTLTGADGLDGTNGTDGREVTFQVADDYIKWQYVGDTTWTNLISIATITGADGIDGTNGVDGKEVILQVTDDYIQWQYVGDTTWTNLIALSTLTGADGLDGTNGTDGREVTFQVADDYIKWQYVGDTTWTNLISIATITGADGIPVTLRVDSDYIQWQYVGDTTWTNLIALSTLTGADGLDGTNGTDGREVTFQVADDYIKWQYVGDATWTNLISIATITGADGIPVTLRVDSDYIQWQYVGDTTWTDLIALSDLTGAAGSDGKEVEMQLADGYIQWHYVGETTWLNLVSVASITGADGIDGKEVTFQTSTTHIQWQYVGDTVWTDLIELATLIGPQGVQGVGISSAVVNEIGELVITYTDATVVNLGQLLKVCQVVYKDYNGYILSVQHVLSGNNAVVPTDPSRGGYDFSGWDQASTDIVADLEINATYAKQAYTVNFYAYDGTLLKTESVLYLDGATAPVAPSITGKTFVGWSEDYAAVDANLDIDAEYETNTYHVDFYDYNGSLMSAQVVVHGGSAIAPESPAREGYDFLGWDQPYLNITTDLAIYATYTLETYAITYYDREYAIISTESVERGQDGTPPVAPAIEGYRFIGWDKPVEHVMYDLDVIALYEIIVYEVVFRNYDGSIFDIQHVQHGSDASDPGSPTKVGWSFTGWNQTYISVTEDLDIAPVFSQLSYQVDFYDELGNLVDSQTVLHGEDAVDPYPTTPSLIKTGYEFVGWDETLKNVTANLTCHPIYEIITYEVTFVDDNYHVFDVQTINHGSTAYSPLTPSKTGYDFVGWDTDFSSVTADLIVMATYEIRSFVVDFYDAQSNLLVSESVNYMDSATEPMAPIIIGYDFVSWDKDFSQVTSSMSIYPIYQIKTYEVVFHDNDGAILSSQTIYHGDDAVAPTDMDLFGYTFNGWDTIYTDVVCDLEVHPLYTVNEYSVVFEENGGSSVTDRSNVTHGSTISLEIPVQLGYRFTGWYFGDTENDAKFYATTPVTGDLTLYARWELASYDVIFYDYDDTILRKSLIGHGYTAIAPDDPSRVGYTFEGWDTSFHVVVTDLSIHPIYIAIDYPLTVDENGGTYVPDMLIAYDTSIPLLVEPSRNGYTFVGWFKDSLLTIPFVNDGSTELMPLNGLSVYAKWDINQYTISFEENGGSTIDDITLDYNTVIQEPTEPTRTGYTFKGWFSDPDFSTEYEFTNMPAENITLYAKWQINEYEVYYFAENVNLSEPGLINIDTNDFFVQISGGGDHTIALTNEGRVFTWGYNNWRQLGDGTVLTRTSPVEITANLPLNTGEKVVVVGAGSLHTVVLTSEGRIFTWGNNDYGQLGNDQTSWITINDITARFDLGSEERVIKLSVGDYHSGVITSAGRVFVWGSNSYGKLGDGTAINSLVPIEITQQFSLTGDEIISSLALGAVHSAAVTSYGRVFTWGYNNYGQLGDGLTTSLASPTEITSNFGLAIDEYVTDIDVNGNFSLAITSDNRIFTWGLNSEYQLGDGTNISKLLPNEITHMFDLAEGETFASASLGTIFAGVSTSLERVFTWGYNGYSQLGTGTTLSGHSPFEITGNFNMSCEDEGVVEVSMGASHSTALTSSGQIHVWGKNFYGQLGIGTTTISAYPVQPKLYHSMLLEKFEVYAYNATLTEYIPTRTGYSFDQWYTDVAMTNPYVFSTMPADDVYLYSEWIVNSYTISFEENGGSEVVDITQDYKTTVVAPTEPTRTAYTFIGWFADIDLTVPYTFSTMPAENITLYAKWTNVPYTISFEENGGSEVTDITAFYNEPVDAPADPTREGYTFMGWFADAGLTTPYEFTTMPLDGTTVYADWEINQYSLSFNAIEEYLNPQFENGANHSLLLTQDNRLYAVGYNSYGQLGNGTLTNTTTKIDITDFLGLGELESIQKIVAAYHSSFVLTTDGRLLVTGINSDGQLGIGDLVNRNVFCDITANFNLATGETITNVFSGGLVTFVLTSEGRIFGFGDNYVGSVGDGTSNNDRTLPVDITANFDLEIGETITSVEIGYYHAYAITSNHRVFSWGRNTYGQLGIGSSADQSLPIDITANFPLEVGDTITMVSAGLDFGIALSESGRVFTWGYNYYGMLGVNYTGNIYSPREITTAFYLEDTDRIIHVTASEYNGQAISESGRIYSWGYGYYYVIGNGASDTQYAPFEITAYFKLFADEVVLDIEGYTNSMHAITSEGRIFVWGQGGYGVHFDGNTSSKSTPVNVVITDIGLIEETIYDYDQTIIYPVDPVREGYTFDGWYQDLDYLTPFASVDMPAANITAYAKWTPNERTITFNSNGGSAVATITNVYRTTISQPANPTREGYSFKGWYEDEGFTIPYRFVFIEDRDVTLYAKWEINQYNFIAYNDQAEMEFTTIAVGEEHILALTGSSQIFAWGDNVYGQLGNNSTTSSSLPIDITKYFPLATGEGIIEIYAGNDFSAALTSDGRLFTWGYNGYGQLGLGTYTNYYSTPQDVTDMLLLADGETIDLVFVSRSAIHVVTSDGRVLGWGSSDMSGAYGIRRRPYDITPYFNFNPGETLVELSGGYQFIMAITSDDRIFGWGYDGYSGSFASGDYYYASAPVDFTSSFASILEPGESISDLEGADKVMFALTTSGRLLGWGYNQYGELLDGTTTKRSYPIDMTPSLSLDALEYIDHISAGWYHVSLLTSEGRMLTWGRNNFYQLGTMTTTDSMVPVDVTANMGVSDGDGIRQVVNTNYSSFVVTHNDHLIRFGNNQGGILGDGTTTTRSIPAQMSLVTWRCYDLYRLEFADVLPTITDPGKYENTFDGWFENTGLTTPFTTTNMPAADFAIYAKWIPNQYSISFETNGGNAITAITLDYDSTINLPADPTKQGYTFAGWFTDAALSTPFTLPLMPEYDFTLYAGWTINVYNITYYYDLEPIQYIQVSNGGLHTIALTANGQVFTWGWNYYGQLGDGTTSSKQIPVDITANFYLNEGEKIINVYALYTHSVALTDSGRVFTWGYNTQGQLGDGTTTNRSLPVDITANFNFDSSETAVSIYRANQSVFVLTSLNKIFAFGSNSDGVLGYGDSINHVLPVEITGKFNLGTGETITMISGGLRHVMAISSTGRVFAWGYNSGNQFVFASTTPSGSLVPLDITNNLNLASGETITFIAAGNGQNYALTSLGKLLAWGYGKLGDGTTNYSATPINLMDYITLNPEESIIKIQAGNAYVLALSTDARLFSWGNNSAGQLGDGTTTERLLPVDVTNNFTFEVGENLSTLFTGYTASSSFVLSNIGGLYSFGLNNYGLLGDNTTTNRSVPTEINHIAFSYLITKQFDYQEAIVHIADPEKTGYTFAGWYTDTALTQAFTLTNMPSSHVKLYAKWQ